MDSKSGSRDPDIKMQSQKQLGEVTVALSIFFFTAYGLHKTVHSHKNMSDSRTHIEYHADTVYFFALQPLLAAQQLFRLKKSLIYRVLVLYEMENWCFVLILDRLSKYSATHH